jgi:hypothetical protein
MANDADSGVPRGWRTSQVYAMACICLAVGLVLGYLYRGSASSHVSVPQAAQASVPASASAGVHPQMARPSLEEMKHMADKGRAASLGLKSDPNNLSRRTRLNVL